MRLITVSMISALLLACGGPPIADAEAAAEDLDRRGLVAMVSDSYADARGNDRDAVSRLLGFYFLRQKSVILVMKIDSLTVIDETAAEILVTAAGAGTTTRSLGLNADAYQFSLELEKDDDKWMLIGARWGELGQELH